MRSFLRIEKKYYTVTGVVIMMAVAYSVIALAYGSSTAQNPRQVILVYETVHNPPRALGRGTAINWKKPGLTLELLRLVGDRLDIEFVFRRMPWKRGLYLLGKNEVDGIFHASFKAARESIGVYPKKVGQLDKSRAIFSQSYVLYKPEVSQLEFDGDEIQNINGAIGAISNYAIVTDLEEKGYNVEQATTLEINFDRLAKGKIAAFAMLENMADDFLTRNNDKYTDIVKLGPPLKTKPYYLLFSRKFVEENEELAEQIWDAIAEIKASDTFLSISASY